MNTWDFLYEAYKTRPIPNTSFDRTPLERGYRLVEYLNGRTITDYTRTDTGEKRLTKITIPYFGCFSLDYTRDDLTIVEGFSDYLTSKLILGNVNTIGILSASRNLQDITYFRKYFKHFNCYYDADQAGRRLKTKLRFHLPNLRVNKPCIFKDLTASEYLKPVNP